MTEEQERDRVDVLLVEDNPGDVRLIREALDDGGSHSVMHVVTDGEEALDFLYQRRSHETVPRPDVVLLDLNLPKVSGIDVLEELKSDDDLKCIPVIVLTGSEAEQDVIESYERHTNAYLTKPVKPEEFLSLIRTFEEFWARMVQLPPKPEHHGP